MTPRQIEFIKSLDKEKCNGTIQTVLMSKNLNQMIYIDVLEFLLTNIKKEKDYLVAKNIELCGIVDGLNKKY